MKGKILGLVSCKGGVGKTTATANLGVALANEFGKNVLALDGNISAANLGLHLGLVYPPITIQDVLKNKKSILQATYIHKSGLHVIPSSLSFEGKINTRQLWRKIEKLKNQYELILIDSAPGLGKEVVNVMKAADELLVITTPDIPCVISVMKSVELAKKMKVPIIGTILNRVRNDYHELNGKEISDSLEASVIAKIPENDDVPKSIAFKIPIVQYKPYSTVSISYKKLAGHIIGEEYKLPSTWDRIKEFFRKIKVGQKKRIIERENRSYTNMGKESKKNLILQD